MPAEKADQTPVVWADREAGHTLELDAPRELVRKSLAGPERLTDHASAGDAR